MVNKLNGVFNIFMFNTNFVENFTLFDGTLNYTYVFLAKLIETLVKYK